MNLMFNLILNLMKSKLLLLSLFALTLFLGLSAQTDPGTDNLTHSWKFEDGTVADPVGGAVGGLHGTASIENGDLIIDADEEWVDLPALLIGISAYTQLSVTTWFTTLADEAINDGYHMLWYFGGSEIAPGETNAFGSNGIFLSPARGDGYCRTAISTGNVANPWTTENGVNRSPEVAYGDSMYHMVTTINDSYMAFYVNGELVDTANLTGDNSLSGLSDDNAWIGRGGYSADPNYWCKVHEVEMYNDILSADEVLYLYQHSPIVTGVQNVNSEELKLNIYSHEGEIFIQNISNADISSVQIFDILGRPVYQSNKFEEVINANLPSNIYIIRVQSNLGSLVTKVFVE